MRAVNEFFGVLNTNPYIRGREKKVRSIGIFILLETDVFI